MGELQFMTKKKLFHRIISVLAISSLLVAGLAGCKKEKAPDDDDDITNQGNKSNKVYIAFDLQKSSVFNFAEIGTVYFCLDREQAPITVDHFLDLVNRGYYNGSPFTSVAEGYYIKGTYHYAGGEEPDPIIGEFEANGYKNNISHKRGVISMMHDANDVNSATDQFFITISNVSDQFDGLYAAFGTVIAGMEYVDQICAEVVPAGPESMVLSGGNIDVMYSPIINIAYEVDESIAKEAEEIERERYYSTPDAIISFTSVESFDISNVVANWKITDDAQFTFIFKSDIILDSVGVYEGLWSHEPTIYDPEKPLAYMKDYFYDSEIAITLPVCTANKPIIIVTKEHATGKVGRYLINVKPDGSGKLIQIG